MSRQNVVASALVSLVSIPAFLLGHKLRHGDASAPALAFMLVLVILIAGAIMRQFD